LKIVAKKLVMSKTIQLIRIKQLENQPKWKRYLFYYSAYNL
jgi:hypothetical protein